MAASACSRHTSAEARSCHRRCRCCCRWHRRCCRHTPGSTRRLNRRPIQLLQGPRSRRSWYVHRPSTTVWATPGSVVDTMAMAMCPPGSSLWRTPPRCWSCRRRTAGSALNDRRYAAALPERPSARTRLRRLLPTTSAPSVRGTALCKVGPVHLAGGAATATACRARDRGVDEAGAVARASWSSCRWTHHRSEHRSQRRVAAPSSRVQTNRVQTTQYARVQDDPAQAGPRRAGHSSK